jgi:hypothetical protein
MEDRPSLAQRISDKLDAGELPSIAPLKLWDGFRTGNPACGEPIHPSRVQAIRW